jgi:hypothetical protein
MNRRFSILNRYLLIAIAVGLLFTATHSAAQAGATFRIPFAFTANHQLVPAGYYKVELLSDRFLAFINEGTGRTETVLMVRPESGPAIETRSRLVFQSSVNRHYLREVKIAGTNIRSELMTQYRFEKDIAKNQLPAASTVELATK